MGKNADLLAERVKHVPQGPATAHPVFAAKAEGAVITDVEGKEYIDFSGGIGVLNVGHCNKDVVAAAEEQMHRFIHTCFHVAMYEPYVKLAKKMNELTPGDFPKKTMFVNSGAEAVENAIKIARHATGKSAIIAFQDAFHGRTLLALSLTSKAKPFKVGFGPYAPEIYRMPYAYCYRCAYDLEYPSCDLHCARCLREFFYTHVAAEQVSALLVEPVLGEGGFVPPPKGFLNILHDICKESGIVFIVDEIQTGFGRTGKLFASEHFELAPDIMVMAKSIAGGFPLSAVTGRAELMDHPQVGGLGGTYSGNPVSCSAGLAVVDYIEKHSLLARAQVIGAKVMERFQLFKERYPVVGDVRGLGAMVGMELVVDRKTKEHATVYTKAIVDFCREKGLLMMSAGTHSNIIRPLMPLVISDDLLEKGLAIIGDALEAVKP